MQISVCHLSVQNSIQLLIFLRTKSELCTFSCWSLQPPLNVPDSSEFHNSSAQFHTLLHCVCPLSLNNSSLLGSMAESFSFFKTHMSLSPSSLPGSPLFFTPPGCHFGILVCLQYGDSYWKACFPIWLWSLWLWSTHLGFLAKWWPHWRKQKFINGWCTN